MAWWAGTTWQVVAWSAITVPEVMWHGAGCHACHVVGSTVSACEQSVCWHRTDTVLVLACTHRLGRRYRSWWRLVVGGWVTRGSWWLVITAVSSWQLVSVGS